MFCSDFTANKACQLKDGQDYLVYIIRKLGVIQYVGMTKSPKKRFAAHSSLYGGGIEMSFMNVRSKDLAEKIEKSLIWDLMPPRNSEIGKGGYRIYTNRLSLIKSKIISSRG